MLINRDSKQNIIIKFTMKEIFAIVIKRKLIFPRNIISYLADTFLRAELNFQEEDKKNVS